LSTFQAPSSGALPKRTTLSPKVVTTRSRKVTFVSDGVALQVWVVVVVVMMLEPAGLGRVKSACGY
jgi:hypothetical protein